MLKNFLQVFLVSPIPIYLSLTLKQVPLLSQGLLYWKNLTTDDFSKNITAAVVSSSEMLWKSVIALHNVSKQSVLVDADIMHKETKNQASKDYKRLVP